MELRELLWWNVSMHAVKSSLSVLFQAKRKRSKSNILVGWIHECIHVMTRCWFELQFFRHQPIQLIKMTLTRTWFEHATFWSGVRRATVAPPSPLGWEHYVSKILELKALLLNCRDNKLKIFFIIINQTIENSFSLCKKLCVFFKLNASLRINLQNLFNFSCNKSRQFCRGFILRKIFPDGFISLVQENGKLYQH